MSYYYGHLVGYMSALVNSSISVTNSTVKQSLVSQAGSVGLIGDTDYIIGSFSLLSFQNAITY